MKLPADAVAAIRSRLAGRRVCVTGGAGFIGGHLVDCLVSVGASVTVIDDLSNSNLDHLAGLIEVEPTRVRFVQGSILEDLALADALEGCSLVFHLAAVGSVQRSVESPERSWAVNATGTLRVLEAARAASIRRVVFAASSSAYGDTERLPKVEAMPSMPRSPYAASKLAGEHLLTAWAAAFGMDTISLRYFNVFGPRQPADSAYAAVVPAFARRVLSGHRPVIYGDGEQSRDFTFVANAALATLLAGTSERSFTGEVVNVGSGRRVSILALARLIAERCGRADLVPEHRPARAGDVRHSLADLTRARDLLGYQPFAPLEVGLDETIESLRGDHTPAPNHD
ncbi:MAG: NAD-dependent epimerase/dehydratase family protein [Phycisphaerales bacterium]|nr:NAD-dependent epimerase/dehydratase family protein [Phycisphaerales bacterium]